VLRALDAESIYEVLSEAERTLTPSALASAV